MSRRNYYLVLVVTLWWAAQSGCVAPIGADRVSTSRAYEQNQESPIKEGQLSGTTKYVLHRFEQQGVFTKTPDATLKVVHQKAVENGERGLLFALSELNYATAERVRHNLQPWEPRDARDYYLASAVYAWLYLFGEAAEPPPSPFDQHFRAACDLYNFALGWALTERRGTNATAVLSSGDRRLPNGELEFELKQPGFPWELSSFEQFVVADQFSPRGLSVRNRQPGLGSPLMAISGPGPGGLRRVVPATAFLRFDGQLKDIGQKKVHASLEIYSDYEKNSVTVGGSDVPLRSETTVAAAYSLNQSFVWKIGMTQFLSSFEQVPTDVYLTQPYRPGRIPVVFVHGTFSSPVWWAEMMNTLAADPVLSRSCQFWYFIYNSGNPVAYSANRLRESLVAKIKELDPEGKDDALQQMVVVGHSQGGLLTKLTATATEDKLLEAVLGTNKLSELNIPPEHLGKLRKYTNFEPLPFVKRVVFISTPHRGSYAAGNFLRVLARKMVTLPSTIVKNASEFSALSAQIDLPPELRGPRTSLDGMSTKNPGLLALAEIPVAPNVKAHSIIAIQGNGDFKEGKDGLVAYESAHQAYAESEFIVHSFHSCQDKPSTIEEVRRILHKHVKAVPGS